MVDFAWRYACVFAGRLPENLAVFCVGAHSLQKGATVNAEEVKDDAVPQILWAAQKRSCGMYFVGIKFPPMVLLIYHGRFFALSVVCGWYTDGFSLHAVLFCSARSKTLSNAC